MSLLGLHHVSAICADAQKNVDFYVTLLGLRLVKVTVNFDDPLTYHLYYGDAAGSPGSLMTFFVWPGGHRGRVGPPQATSIAYAIDPNSLDFWQRRLRDAGVHCSPVGERFDEPFIHFQDPDGMTVDLIGTERALPAVYESTVEAQHTLRTMHSVTLHERALDLTAETLTRWMDLREHATEGDTRRFSIGEGGVGKFVDVHFDATKPAGHLGAGIVHHVAFRVADDPAQRDWQTRLYEGKIGVTDVKERTYFRSVYFREPGGVLFELATDGPGFGVDEAEGMGRSLKIPTWTESRRAEILARLPKFSVSGLSFP